MKIIKTRCGSEIKVCNKDYEFLNKIKWHLNNHGYPRCAPSFKFKYLMHSLLIKPKENFVVDHINQNKLDNRRCNLRYVNKSQNAMNSGKSKSRKGRALSSKYRGVYCDKRYGSFDAYCTKDGKRFYAGRFSDEIGAAKARDKLAKKLHGEFAYLNFPEDR